MVASRYVPRGLGWQPPLPDLRDYTLHHPEVGGLLAQHGIGTPTRRHQVCVCDLFPQVHDQGTLNAACAFAVLDLITCLQPGLEASPLFLYQMSLRLRGFVGDAGVDLRTVFKALRRFGSPPEQVWPYDPVRLAKQPLDPVLFCYAHDFQPLVYVRLGLDPQSGQERLGLLRSSLAAGIPFALGFPVPVDLAGDGHISAPPADHPIRGGQAAIAVGYDDTRRICNHKGAFQIRNSWGSAWGSDGYGWLPYELVARTSPFESWIVIPLREFTSVRPCWGLN
jgi:hypothetical protein